MSEQTTITFIVPNEIFPGDWTVIAKTGDTAHVAEARLENETGIVPLMGLAIEGLRALKDNVPNLTPPAAKPKPAAKSQAPAPANPESTSDQISSEPANQPALF